ncbi:glucosamine-6-phosphate deaminase [Isoalcanivorax beigongshangi]|uniref:Glucosamine-6-phosphate deaminase n=1 Tax=Isoalcanivorax beigongshangi TaxID=3238810 RepID=A0ABV4ADY6_9GAMM
MYLIFDDVQDVARYTARQLYRVMARRPRAVLGLATGGTMEPVYAELLALLAQQPLELSGLSTFNLDEYVGLSPCHSQSYAYYMDQHLFRHLPLAAGQARVPNGIAADLAAESSGYSGAIAAAGGLDLQLLGVGSNGHIGFNEPGTPFDAGTHVVELSEQTRHDNARFFDAGEVVPCRAITMGLRDILQARELLFVATGRSKAPIMEAIHGSAPSEQIPATAIKTHARSCIVLDAAAAERLPAAAQQEARALAREQLNAAAVA